MCYNCYLYDGNFCVNCAADKHECDYIITVIQIQKVILILFFGFTGRYLPTLQEIRYCLLVVQDIIY